jgi:hypothetical protein
VSRDFRPSIFFHKTISPRALIHGLKPFRIWLRLRRGSGFGGLYQTADVALAVSMRPRKPNFFRSSFVQRTTFLCINNVVDIFLRIPRSPSDRGSCSCSLYQTPEVASAVYIRLPKLVRQSISDHGSGFRGLYQTAEAIHFQRIISIFSTNSKPYSKRL